MTTPVSLGKTERTVADLREKLQDLPADYVVVLEGCDCYGTWNGEIEVHKAERKNERNAVLLTRDH